MVPPIWKLCPVNMEVEDEAHASLHRAMNHMHCMGAQEPVSVSKVNSGASSGVSELICWWFLKAMRVLQSQLESVQQIHSP